MDFVKYVSHLIENQFPSVFRDEGEELVTFIKAYYEWVEEEYLSKGKSLTSYSDIDDTLDLYINHFVEKYMYAIPENILQDRRLLQKHILDLYRAKGSQDSIRLLFRLLFNEEIELYVPAKDMLKTSDGVWVEKKYIEISQSSRLSEFIGKSITGVDSGAKAFVESYERRLVNQKYIDIFFIENIRGTFQTNERVRYDDDNTDLPYIMGSATNIEIITSFNDFSVGDILEFNDTNPLKVRVTSLKSTGDTIIEPLIVDGGSGYTTSANVIITSGSNTSGSGFDFRVSSLSNTSVLVLIDNPLSDLIGVDLNAFDYGLDEPANSSIPFADYLNIDTIEVGKIASIEVLNPGTDYDGNVSISVIDPIIAPLQINDGAGGYLGNNAVIRGDAIYGDDLISSVFVVDSGINFADGEIITLQHTSSNKTAQGIIRKEPVGRAEGYYIGTHGNLSSNKYLQDSYYYQEFSYEVITRQTLDRFRQVLIDSVHPVGNEIFAKFRSADSFSGSMTVDTERSAESAFWVLGSITDLNFETNRYLVSNKIVNISTLDDAYHLRNSEALKYNPVLGTYEAFDVDDLRRHSDGYLSEPFSVNLIDTSWSANTIPNTWTITSSLSNEITDIGDEGGVKYIEFRLYGTTSSNTVIEIYNDSVDFAEHSLSIFNNFPSNTGITGATLKLTKTVNGVPLTTSVPLTLDNTLLSDTRKEIITEIGSDVTNVKIEMEISTITSFIDTELRIGSPQFEQSGYVSSPIRVDERSSDTFEMSPVQAALNHTEGAMFWKGKITGSSNAYNSQILTFETTDGLIQFEVNRENDLIIRTEDGNEKHNINNSNSEDEIVIGISWNANGAIGKIGNNAPVSISGISFSPSVGINIY